MKIKKYTNGAWTDLDKPVKKYDTYTDETTTLPLTIEASTTDAIENYLVYGTSEGAGVATESGEPAGYKIPILNTSGETECEKIANMSISPDGTLDPYGSVNAYSMWIAQVEAGETYIITTDDQSGQAVLGYFTNYPKQGDTAIDKKRHIESTTFKALYTGYIAFRSTFSFEGGLIKASSDIPIYIGNTKLYEDEYLDFVEQKVYKDISGTLTPTDPPVPLPAIQAYQGENTLSSTETLGEVTVKYEGWKGVGDVEKYQNGEWSDNNGT